MVCGVAAIDVQHQLAHWLAPFGELVTLLSLTQRLLPLPYLAALRCTHNNPINRSSQCRVCQGAS